MPKVTVLMSVYNGERFLREAIESILVQSFQDFEFIIIDDGSTDSTLEIIQSYDDTRIRLIENEMNLGLSRSLNRGLKLAKGQFIARQDADDVSEPERLARQVTFLETHNDVVLLGTSYQEIDTHGSLIGKRKLPCDYTEIRWSLLFFCPFVHSAVMLRKSIVLEQIGFYNEALAYAMDYDLWYRIARCLPVANLDEYLVRYRINPRSMTATYGDRVQEGIQISIANIANLLCWDKTDMVLNEARFNLFFSLLYGPCTDSNLNDVIGLTDEILQLHTVFCQSYEVSPRDRSIHCIKLCSWLSRKVIEIAYHRLAQGDFTTAKQLFTRVYQLHWPTLFKFKTFTSGVRLMIGNGLATSILRKLKEYGF